MRKLDTHSISELVRYAVRNQIMSHEVKKVRRTAAALRSEPNEIKR